mgnify:CR=1 FL=1
MRGAKGMTVPFGFVHNQVLRGFFESPEALGGIGLAAGAAGALVIKLADAAAVLGAGGGEDRIRSQTASGGDAMGGMNG